MFDPLKGKKDKCWHFSIQTSGIYYFAEAFRLRVLARFLRNLNTIMKVRCTILCRVESLIALFNTFCPTFSLVYKVQIIQKDCQQLLLSIQFENYSLHHYKLKTNQFIVNKIGVPHYIFDDLLKWLQYRYSGLVLLKNTNHFIHWQFDTKHIRQKHAIRNLIEIEMEPSLQQSIMKKSICW